MRGTIPSIAPGVAFSVVVTYVEWLDPQPTAGGDVGVQYRLPLAAASNPPVVGEFLARIDSSGSNPKSITAGQGARVTGGVVELRKSDFKPSADLVVEVQMASSPTPARMTVAPADSGDDGGDYVLVRTSVPDATPEDGVTLALVIDASESIDPALLDAEKAFAQAIVNSLGTRDKIVVFGASDELRAVGPDAMGMLDEGRRKAILEALPKVQPGGATDLGHALEGAADALGSSAAGMIVYVGDGWPTIGDSRVDDIRA